MDLQLPTLDGLEATRQIRELEKQSGRQRVPIIAVTAHTSKKFRENVIRAGMDDFIEKPLKADELLESVPKHLPAP